MPSPNPSEPERSADETPAEHDSYAIEDTPPAPHRGHPALAPPTVPGADFRSEAAARRSRRDARRRLDAVNEEEAFRESVIVPSITLAVGVVLVTLIRLIGLSPAEAGLYLVSFLCSVPIGIGVYLFFCVLWIGFDAPFHLIALRIAAAFAAVDLAVTVATVTGFGLLAIPIAIITYVAMLVKFMEIDLVEAAIIGLVTLAVRFVIAFIVLASFMGP